MGQPWASTGPPKLQAALAVPSGERGWDIWAAQGDEAEVAEVPR